MFNKYLTMEKSKIYKDEFGNAFPDIFSFKIDKFQYTQASQKYALTSEDIKRFDLLIQNFYGTSEFEDLVLWLNRILLITDKNPGDIIFLPTTHDLENYYRENSV